MKEYVIWAAEQIEKDYPGYDWDCYMYLVTNSRVCDSIYRYSMKRYLEVK